MQYYVWGRQQASICKLVTRTLYFISTIISWLVYLGIYNRLFRFCSSFPIVLFFFLYGKYMPCLSHNMLNNTALHVPIEKL